MVIDETFHEFIQFKESEVENYKNLPFLYSYQGVYMEFSRGLSLSSCGNKFWGCHIKKIVENNYISKLMMYDFKKKSRFFYDYEHQHLISSVFISEAYDLAMSGGLDETLVLHDLKSGKKVKKFDMKYGGLSCLFDLGTAVAVVDYDTLRFLNMETKKMKKVKVKTGVEWINCINLVIGGSDPNDEMVLLVGDYNFNKIDKIGIPQTILKLGKDFFEMEKKYKNRDKMEGKIIDLKNENKRLREENHFLTYEIKELKKIIIRIIMLI